MKQHVTIQWLGHSCFKITAKGSSVVLDPYADGTVPGLSPLHISGGQVYCSHEHPDHNAADLVKPENDYHHSPFAVQVFPSYHDNVRGLRRGKNNLTLLEVNGFRLAHLGDLGCKLTSEQEEALRGIDVLMIPVGGYYTIDAEEAANLSIKLSPRVVIPMHYRSETFGYPVIGVLDEFTKRMKNVVVYDTDTFELTPKVKPQVAVLCYCGGGES